MGSRVGEYNLDLESGVPKKALPPTERVTRSGYVLTSYPRVGGPREPEATLNLNTNTYVQ
jgi:hypothetical protein